MKLIDGKLISAEIQERLKQDIEKLEKKPGLAVILVGEDPASCVYVRNKEKMCQKLGIQSLVYRLPAETTEEELLKLIDELNINEEVDGILLQHPVPAQIDERKAFNKIAPEKDVDGFHMINRGKLAIGEDCFVACTPLGVITMLKHENIEIEGKRAVIVGRSNIVGKPLYELLLKENATVTVCHSKTKNLKEVCAEADILIAAIGKPKFVTADMVKEGAVVVDVGINRIDGKLIGDVDFENVKEKASYITPVPGGVGPMTMATLMENVLKAYQLRKK
ncbi:MAG: bifunctional methylenetetrahydrofolate dehydrogenase/methenyltetrahydrofolate cyclohydrolase FolD [Clostridia bacterium]|nr:bifunctional methylenetetrahydrofolate dehydrogenase/methenyltetrahydrofolate cyclohydrolase FolD [Clostridia bacterium]